MVCLTHLYCFVKWNFLIKMELHRTDIKHNVKITIFTRMNNDELKIRLMTPKILFNGVLFISRFQGRKGYTMR